MCQGPEDNSGVSRAVLTNNDLQAKGPSRGLTLSAKEYALKNC